MDLECKARLSRELAQLTGKQKKIALQKAAEMRVAAQRVEKGKTPAVEDFLFRLLCPPADAPGRRVVGVQRGAVLLESGDEIERVAPHREEEAVVGDLVTIERGRVFKILPRRTSISRTDPGVKARERVIVANIAVVVVVASVGSPPLRPGLIDRYLAAIRHGGAEALVVVNKADSVSPEELHDELRSLDRYRSSGVEILVASAATGVGLEEVRSRLSGKLSVFVGHSGVGKSSLLRALAPETDAEDGAVSAKTGRGRHTTTGSCLHRTEEGLEIIDTPGVREFGLTFKDEGEIARAFAEFEPYLGKCRFADCRHLSEPGCVLVEAVRSGHVPRERYVSYRKLLGEQAEEPPDYREVASEGFECRNCGVLVPPATSGTEHRNHCPYCLHSIHVDVEPGDRAAVCDGVMEPVSVWVRKGGEWAIIHRCRRCGHFGSNRIAPEDNEMLLLSVAVRPLSQPAFPLERIGRLG